MDRSLIIRAVVIVAVVGLAGWIAYPPQETINLGLDLQGGMHLVLQVEVADAMRTDTDKQIDLLQQELDDLGIAAQIDRTGDTTFEVAGVPADRDAELKDDIFEPYFEQSWDYSRSGDRLRFAMNGSEKNNISDLAVRQAEETIRNRIDAFGVAEPVIHREGISGHRIVVQLPGVDDPERVKALIGQTAFLEFRLAVDDVGPAKERQAILDYYGGAMPDEVEILAEDLRDENKRTIGQQFWAIEKKRVISGRDLKNAQPTLGDFNEPTVGFLLTREGGRKFGDVTGANVGRRLAIILDNKVISAPSIQSRITENGVIHGSFTNQEAQDLVTVLKSGSLPASITYLEERTVGPSLGADSIDKGTNAGFVGASLVVLTMLVVYQLTGLNAVFALALNIALIFGALAMFDATLTVPGIAGIVLTIGMAVDANVLVFERIREELRAGRTVRSAIAAGFGKALSSILDANVTTLIAAMFLFMFGTGPIQGFAVTLSIGIVASIFTAVFVSRWLFDLLHSRRPQQVDTLSIG